MQLPLRVAVLCSQRAPGLLELLEHDFNRGRAYEIVAVVTSEASFAGQRDVERCAVRTHAHSIHNFYKSRDALLYRDFAVRAAYDRETVALLAPYAADILLLDGYLYIATRELLDAFPARVLNLHFSDLTLRRSDGSPLYPGIRAVRDAIVGGRTETAATVHLVNDVPDGGAPLVKSWPFPVSPLAADALAWSSREIVNAYAFAHQEWMIRAASGPLLHAALALITGGMVDLDHLARLEPAAIRPRGIDAPEAESRNHVSDTAAA